MAEALGYPGADALMADVARAARTVAWIADEGWDRVDVVPRRPDRAAGPL